MLVSIFQCVGQNYFDDLDSIEVQFTELLLMSNSTWGSGNSMATNGLRKRRAAFKVLKGTAKILYQPKGISSSK